MFDANQPLQTRDGHAVVIVRNYHGMLVGFVRADGVRDHKYLWDATNGRRFDAIGDDPHDLVNQPAFYDDTYIDYWADEYVRRELKSHGVLLDTFLQYPHAICRAFDGRDKRPLLPAQQRVYRELLQAEGIAVEAGMLPPNARLHGNGYSAPLKHHRYEISRERNNKCA